MVNKEEETHDAIVSGAVKEGLKHAQDQEQPRRFGWIRPVSIAVILSTLLTLALVLSVRGSLRDEFDARYREQAAQIGHSNTVANQLAQQLRQHGITPSVTPSPTTEKGDRGPTGATGPTGPSGTLTPAQVQNAVDAYCASTHSCVPRPSQGQVAQAIVQYCTLSRCQGPKGSTGTSGSPGPAGSPGVSGASGAPGADGENATPAQVAAAVSAYCGQASLPCKGDAGADGSPGPTGSPGATGPTGPAGPVGPTGPSGEAGQPPLSFSFTDALGQQHVCTRTTPFDPTAPKYTCT